jgi:hypothetical protein
MFKSRLLGLLLVSSVAVLGACGGGDSFDDRADIADPVVRFVHAAPGAPDVTLQRNGVNELYAVGVPYKSASQYQDVDTERYTFTLRAATGGTTDLASTVVEAQRGKKHTLIALPTATGVELVSITDPYNKRINSDDSRVRVVNAAANVQPFDVYLTPVNVNIATATPVLSDITYKEAQPASGTDSIDVEDGTYRLMLTPTGSKTVIFNAAIDVPRNGDWLLVVLPDDLTLTNSVRVLLVRSDNIADPTDEIVSQ